MPVEDGVLRPACECDDSAIASASEQGEPGEQPGRQPCAEQTIDYRIMLRD